MYAFSVTVHHLPFPVLPPLVASILLLLVKFSRRLALALLLLLLSAVTPAAAPTLGDVGWPSTSSRLLESLRLPRRARPMEFLFCLLRPVDGTHRQQKQ